MRVELATFIDGNPLPYKFQATSASMYPVFSAETMPLNRNKSTNQNIHCELSLLSQKTPALTQEILATSATYDDVPLQVTDNGLITKLLQNNLERQKYQEVVLAVRLRMS